MSDQNIQTKDETKKYLDQFSGFKKTAPGKNIGWLKSVREKAINNFSELGIPTVRDEDWRFTNLVPLARTSFDIPADGRGDLSKETVEQFTIPDLTGNRLVFVDGRFSPELSSVGSTSNGLKVKSLAEAFEEEQDFLEEHLARYADFDSQAFTALNTAFMEDGGFVYIPSGTVMEEPIQLLYISMENENPIITNPRNLIIVEDNCQANIIEHYVSLSDRVYFSNVVSEVIVGENSTVGHYLIELEGRRSFNISTLRSQQSRNSNMRSHTMLMGGSLVRNNVHPVLAGEGCDSLINGLFMSTGRQHMDNYMRVEHASPHCDSRQYYNGVLDAKSRGVFHGRIVVHEGAQKTDAKQTNRNLLLSDSAQIDTKPQLEIYADDVKCTHGATIGQIDEKAVFYLRSRGITEDDARDILLNAFTNESIGSMQVDEIKKYCENLASGWFRRRKEALES